MPVTVWLGSRRRQSHISSTYCIFAYHLSVRGCTAYLASSSRELIYRCFVYMYVVCRCVRPRLHAGVVEIVATAIRLCHNEKSHSHKQEKIGRRIEDRNYYAGLPCRSLNSACICHRKSYSLTAYEYPNRSSFVSVAKKVEDLLLIIAAAQGTSRPSAATRTAITAPTTAPVARKRTRWG